MKHPFRPALPGNVALMLTRRRLLAASPAALVARGMPSPALSLPDQAILDLRRLPPLTGAGLAAYRAFLLMDLPRAFAIGAGNTVGVAGGALSRQAACREALSLCQKAGDRNARLYAVDLDVIEGGPGPPEKNVPRPLIETWNYSFAPDARFFWRGPALARGVYIWAHGTSSDPNGLQPPPHVRAFNNAGFDVVRFDREPNADDVDRAALWLRDGIRTLRKTGWKAVIAGGHSRGAWNCLQMLKTANLADVVIAESPAAHGIASGFFMSSQTDDLRQIVNDVPDTRTRLAFVQFGNDPFIGDADTRARLIARLRPRLGGLLMIDRPPGFSGHLAARDLRFAVRFSGDLLQFAL
jgi:hypothetical protein